MMFSEFDSMAFAHRPLPELPQGQVNIPERIKGLRSDDPFVTGTALRNLALCMIVLGLLFYVLRSMQRARRREEAEERARRNAEMEKQRRARAEKEAAQSSASFFLAQERGEQIEVLPDWKLKAWPKRSQVWVGGRQSSDELWPAVTMGHGESELKLRCELAGEMPEECIVAGFDEDGALRVFPVVLDYDPTEKLWSAMGDAQRQPLIIREGAVMVSTLLGSVVDGEDEDGNPQGRPVTITSLGFTRATIIDEEQWEEHRVVEIRVALPGEAESIAFRARPRLITLDPDRDLRLELDGASDEDRIRLGRFLALEYFRGRSIQRESAGRV